MYTLLTQFNDINNNPMRVLACTVPGFPEYLVVQSSSQNRLGEPDWTDVFIWPPPEQGNALQLTNVLVQLLKSFGVEFPGRIQNLTAKE